LMHNYKASCLLRGGVISLLIGVFTHYYKLKQAMRIGWVTCSIF